MISSLDENVLRMEHYPKEADPKEPYLNDVNLNKYFNEAPN